MIRFIFIRLALFTSTIPTFLKVPDKYFIYTWAESSMNPLYENIWYKIFFLLFLKKINKKSMFPRQIFFPIVWRTSDILVCLLWSWKSYLHFGVNWNLLMLFRCCFIREHFISITCNNSTWTLNSAHSAIGRVQYSITERLLKRSKINHQRFKSNRFKEYFFH